MRIRKYTIWVVLQFNLRGFPVNEIINLVTKSKYSLEKSLSKYWPVVNPEKNGLQEINLTMHIAAMALSNEMMIYPEASDNNTENGNKRVDLLVKGKVDNKPAFILFESKKLFSAEKAGEMVSDLEKMRNFKYVVSDVSTENDTKGMDKYYVLLALTVSDDIKDWWCEPAQYDMDNNDWDKLREKLLETDTKGFVDVNAMQRQYVLYAVFR